MIRKENGLRTQTRTSHCFVLDIPNWDRPIIVTDAALNIAPDKSAKIAIIQNAIQLAHALGIPQPKTALLSAVENPMPAMPSSVEAHEIAQEAREGKIKIEGGLVDGPFALDNAASRAAARLKGIDSPVAGEADIYIVPAIEAGNIFFKALTFMGGAQSAGLVVGAKAPVMLTSRADSAESRLASAALAVLYGAWYRDR